MIRTLRMTARALGIGLFLSLLLPPWISAAGRPYRVGIVLPGDEWTAGVQGFTEGMKGLGYAEGKDIQYLFENAKYDKKRVAEVTTKFISDKVDAIFTITNTALKVVADITRTNKMPVVFGSASGPVESGIIPAYATAETNITGVTSASIELVAKRLEILKEVLPQVKRVAAIGDLEADSSKAAFAIAKETAPKLGLTLVAIKVKSKEEAVEEARKISRRDADALFLIPGLHGVGAAKEIAAAARAARLPFAMYQAEHVEKDGALLGYGSSYYLQGKQAAVLMDKILRGVPPAGLPIERPRVHKLVLNLQTAREIGITFSPEVLNRADELVGPERGR
jgi:putative ABC transport system substrate-binding protein